MKTLSGQDLSPLGLGLSRVGSFNNPVPLYEQRNVIAKAADLGINVFDTSDIYGQGDSERELGRVLSGRRERAFIVTKVGKLFSTRMRMLLPLKPVLKPLLMRASKGRDVTSQREGNMREDFSPARYSTALEASLSRLKVDVVDGFVLHSPPAHVAGDPRVGAELASLKQAGKVRHYGVSCDDVDTLEAALTMDGIELLELPLNVLDAITDGPISRTIIDREIVVLAREVIRFRPGVRPADAVREVSRRDDVTTVVVGTSKLSHLQELADAACGTSAKA